MIRINLLADRQAKDRKLIQKEITFGIAGVAVAIMAGIFIYGIKMGEVVYWDSKIKTAEQEKAKLENIKKKVEQMEIRQKQVEAILETIEMLTKIKAGPTPYMDSLNGLLPQEIWLTDLDDRMGAIKLIGFSFSPQAVAEFLTKLTNSDEFVAVDLQGTEAVTISWKTSGKTMKREVQKFTIKFMTKLGMKLAEEKAKLEAEAAGKDKKGKKGKKPPKRKGGGH